VSPGLPTLVAARSAGPRRAGFEAEAVSYQVFEQLRDVAAKTSATLEPTRGLVESLRARKEPGELELLTRAVEITSQAFEEVLPLVKPGTVERDLALELEFRMKRAGAEELAFDLIVASGPRSALPHGRASEKALATGEFVVFDIGARHKGYHSDMTRTVFLGKPGPSDRALYQTVLEAQLAGIAATRGGVSAAAVDAASRGVIDKAGHGARFGHGTGHGVGLMVHEAPRVGQTSVEILEEGMTITVEPGIYLPGHGGVRIEDIVLVTREGCRVLTPTSKERWILE
jgi:Xaa-Pro aminopeptidase